MMNFSKNLGLLFFVSLFSINCSAQLSSNNLNNILKEIRRDASLGDISPIRKILENKNLEPELASILLKITVWGQASYQETYSVAKMLIDCGAKYELDEWELDHLYDRVYLDHPEIVDLIVKNMSFSGKMKCKILRSLEFIFGESKERQRFFREIKPKKVEGVTSLMIAAKKADYNELKKLIKSGVNVNEKDSQGHGVLFHCAKSNEGPEDALKCCKYLIKHGAKEDFECDYLDLLYKYDVFSEIRDILYKNMSFFAKIRYKIWKMLEIPEDKN